MSKDQPHSGSREAEWKCRGRVLSLPRSGTLMGILNVTPDSFSDGGTFTNLESAVNHARSMLHEGASILDLGGESTRPGAEEVSGDEEVRRILPVLRELVRLEPEAVLSIDTVKEPVARQALEAGAHIINDVSGLRHDPGMAELVAESGAGLVIMHMQGTPRTMQEAPHYEDVVAEVRQFFTEQIAAARSAGVSPGQIVLDPGIGFGKSLEHNLTLLRHLDDLVVEERPLLLGVSRKSLFQKLLDLPVEKRVLPTALVTAWSGSRGVAIHRVHDVAENRIALQLAQALEGGSTPERSD